MIDQPLTIPAIALLLTLLTVRSDAQSTYHLETNFGSGDTTTYETIGRGACTIANGVFQTKKAYARFGQPDWKNYTIRFSARNPDTADQVQIWAGFRARNRNDRYIIGLRGGMQNNIYLSRQGYMGADEFLALRPLDFHPAPGQWTRFRIEVCGDRIRVFLNRQALPIIDITDKNANLAPSGKVILGGGWLATEYDSLSIEGLPDDALKGKTVKEGTIERSPADKEKQRQAERAAYKPISVSKLNDARTTVSLDGNWLFMPGYEMENETKATSPSEGDKKWHTMNVPDFWNPIRIWLHGETFGPHAKGASDSYFQKETDRCTAYTFDYKKTGLAWYRQWVELPEAVKGKELELSFDAVSKVAEVWINGVYAGGHVGMFGSFRVNGTGLFRPGRNLVTVKVIRDYVKDIQDADKVVDVAVSVPVTNKMLKDLAHGFYNGDPAGIWQPVTLTISDPLKITDVYIRPDLTGASFEVTVKNGTNRSRAFLLAVDIVEKKETGKLLYKGEPVPDAMLNPGEEKKFTFLLKDLKPRCWSPQSPNLYDFTFHVFSDHREADQSTVCSGFRTFESKNGFLYLNGKKYWLRGGNQTPFALAPNSNALAHRFFQLMKAGNIEVTRTHTTPYNELWMDAADRDGIGISFEGTWPWLMLASSMPDTGMIRLWAEEWLDLLHKYRNHPSLLFWTVNNEMKFYDNEPDFQKAKLKMRIISAVVKKMRAIDPSRPIVFDSNYKRNEKKFGKEFFTEVDDGDIDDIHAYINWYDHTIFGQFKGEFQQKSKNEGRPLISQEMSTGYPNGETGHPTRFYTLVHQTPQALVGNLAYEYNDPAYFLRSQAFITGELAEAFRRTNDQASGILHFSLATWFRNVYDPEKIAPYPTYYALKRALQPVLVSAELWGRHFYAGDSLPARICFVNDREDGADLDAGTLDWELVTGNGSRILSGETTVPVLRHAERIWLDPEIRIPSGLPAPKTPARLILKYSLKGKMLSENEYELLLAQKSWSQGSSSRYKKIVLVDYSNMTGAFQALGIPFTSAASVKEAAKTSADVYVFAGLDPGDNVAGNIDSGKGTADDISLIRSLIEKGGKVLLLDAAAASGKLYPEYIRGVLTTTEGDIVNMEIPESSLFGDIDELELRYFNNHQRQLPSVCKTALKINRDDHVEALASYLKVHGYLNGDMQQRVSYMETVKGFTLVRIRDKGEVLLSTMSLEKAVTDPVAGKLLTNMLEELSQTK
ncbi:MAG TPA: glycoside hydrolase family 2 TIM barrel-domain containing protein [Puia sp.]|nr:glycoside hydrolase family 2 TIM barrel-domain containing protein [Puia sp.]